MRRFCSFVKGTRGEELVTFFVKVERLLQIHWQQDGSQRNRYQALLTVIKAVHLTEGSSIMNTCRIPSEGLLKIFSGSDPGGMDQILYEMRSKALCRLQSYWLPQYLCSCKLSITKLKECASIVKEYEDIASNLTLVENPALLDPLGWSLGSPPSEGPTVTRTYCSKVRKRLLWRAHQRPGTGLRVGAAGMPDGPAMQQWLPMAGDGDQGECTNIVHYMSRHGEEIVVGGDKTHGGNGKREGRSKRGGSGSSKRSTSTPLLRKVSSASLGPRTGPVVPILPSKSLSSLDSSSTDPIIPPHACMETPICHLPSITTTPVTPTPAPPSRPVWGTLHYDEHLSLALSADALAGGPYENFLRVSGQGVMLHHLGLWQELDGFLNLLLKMEDGPSKALRQVLARKIMAVYLSDAWQCVSRPEGEWCTTYLTKSTVCHLINLLPSGNVMPWIYTAKQELCQILGPTYNAFLDEEDKVLLFYLFTQNEVKGKVSHRATAPSSAFTAPEQQVRRMREALALCQACAEPLTEETWALLPLEDVRTGGSVHLHYRKTNLYDLPFETLAEKYPKVAVEAISKTHRLYYGWKPVQEETKKPVVTSSPKKSFHLMKDKDHSFAEKPSMRPRFLEEVMRSPTNLDFFKRYLRAYDAHGALNFYHEVDKLRHVDSLLQKTKINSIVSRFLRRADAKDYLQCSANLISQIPKMRYVSPDIIFAAQDLVIKSLEATWFKKYQDSFPPCTNITDTSTRTVVLTNKLKHVWSVFSRFIKSICKFRHAMKDILTRSKFEGYLRHNWQDFSLKYMPSMGSRQIESVDLCSEEVDSSHLKRRVINHKLITVEFLVNDLSFYLETESFRNMADSGTMMASAGMYGENDNALLHQKAEMIIKLFLKSEISPRLRVNIAESARDSIQQAFAMGKVDRGLFHEAIMAVFPNLIFCWKKFCSQKVKKGVVGDNSTKEDSTELHDYLHPFNSDWYRKVQTTMSMTDDYTTLRFTVHDGLNLVLPQTRLELCASVLSPAKSPMARRRSISTPASSEFPQLEVSNQRRRSIGPFLSPQTSLPHSDLTHSSSGSLLSKIKED
ncbi:regulator of G-protein signaling protein-like [Salvelinus sp. IW2-2015]|uniref:regulator of G-protein signaling protein-like n=1 Tax=Salvelinus sp. IW2-2015 TaxID=2691554 RepID=UPI0038D4A11E